MALTLTKRKAENQYFDEFLDGSVLPLRMMLIPSGSFLMGSPDNELERLDSEGPQHKVTLSEFFMAKYPVTQAQWRAVAKMPQVNHEMKSHPSRFNGDQRPVEQVSWYEAVEFCDRLTSHTQRQYRLPTEAEWEYACRAGTLTPFHFGATLSTDYANYNGADTDYGIYGPGEKGEDRQETTLVDYFGVANAYGVCDMHGNVFEWCQDHWHDSYVGASNDGSAWVTERENTRRICRGGSWFNAPRNCRSAYHDNRRPVTRYNNLGFRVVCSAPSPFP